MVVGRAPRPSDLPVWVSDSVLAVPLGTSSLWPLDRDRRHLPRRSELSTLGPPGLVLPDRGVPRNLSWKNRSQDTGYPTPVRDGTVGLGIQVPSGCLDLSGGTVCG